MTDKIIPIHAGIAVPGKIPTHPGVVEDLRHLLAMAEGGQLIGFSCAFVQKTGQTSITISPGHARSADLLAAHMTADHHLRQAFRVTS